MLRRLCQDNVCFDRVVRFDTRQPCVGELGRIFITVRAFCACRVFARRLCASPVNTYHTTVQKLPGGVLSREAEYFNTKLSKIRIRSEHSIGLLKARFQYFKGVRVLIKSCKDLRRIIAFFKAVLVAHNLLIADPVPPELQHEVETECESEARLRTDMKRQTEDASDEDDGTERRDQLLHYLVELDGLF